MKRWLILNADGRIVLHAPWLLLAWFMALVYEIANGTTCRIVDGALNLRTRDGVVHQRSGVLVDSEDLCCQSTCGLHLVVSRRHPHPLISAERAKRVAKRVTCCICLGG